MTKITGISGSNNIAPDTNVEAKDNDLFQHTLDKAIRIKSDAQIDTGNNVLGEIRASAVLIEDGRPHGLNEKANTLLSHLDIFASELNNPERSLKDMEPVVTSMKNDADDIMETMEKEDVADDNLKKIITESAMMANIEYYKYYRGDYL